LGWEKGGTIKRRGMEREGRERSNRAGKRNDGRGRDKRRNGIGKERSETAIRNNY